jgi:hypothetical protein
VKPFSPLFPLYLDTNSAHRSEAESIHDDPTPTESKALRKTRSATNATNTDMTSRQFKSKMNQLHQEILGHKHGPVFNAAVRAVSHPQLSMLTNGCLMSF